MALESTEDSAGRPVAADGGASERLRARLEQWRAEARRLIERMDETGVKDTCLRSFLSAELDRCAIRLDRLAERCKQG